jgi:GNAT superfamily N-acetyltransferase
LPIARIWKHVGLRVARRDTTVTSSLESKIARIDEPTLEQVLDFCAEAPVERVFLDESARRGFGRLLATTDGEKVTALCHFGANVVPSGAGTGVFAEETAKSKARMIIGDEAAVTELWAAAEPAMPVPREDRPGQPVFSIDEAPEPGDSGLRPAGPRDFRLLLPACAATHEGEIGVDPLRADASGFRRRTRQQIEEGRSWVWIEDGTILFKAEASAWTPHAVQLQQVWVDPQARNQGYAQRGLRDLIRLLLGRVPRVCLFVRADNPAAIRLYEAVGMQRVGSYRSLLF